MTKFTLLTGLVFWLCLLVTVKSETCETYLDDTGSLLQVKSATESSGAGLSLLQGSSDKGHQVTLMDRPSQALFSEHTGRLAAFLSSFSEHKELLPELFLLAESNVIGRSMTDRWEKLKPSQKWGTLPMIILMGLAFCLTFIQGSKHNRLMLVTLWGTATVTMNIVNKIAVMAIPLPMTLLVVQMVIADLVLVVGWGPSRMWKEIRENQAFSLRWGLLTMFFSGGLVTSLLAIQAGGVILIVVMRNLMPLLSLLVERWWMPDSTRAITMEAVSALFFLALGTGLYATLEVRASGSSNALGYIVLNMIFMIAYRLVERRLLLGLPEALCFGTLTLMQNVIGLLPVLGLLFLWGEHRTIVETLLQCRQHSMSVLITIFSGIAGLSLGYYSIMLQKEVTATSFLTLQASMKLLTIISAVIVLGEKLGLLSVIGCLVSLVGGTWYGFISNRPQKTSEEPQEGKEECKM